METDPSQIFQLFWSNNSIFLADFNFSLILNALSILVLLICSGLLSGSEVAYFSLSPIDKESLKEENTINAKRILDLISLPKYLLSTILIANNIINIAIILVSNTLLQQLVPSSLPPMFNFFITVVVVTFLLVLFGEIAPKVYANRNNIHIAKLMSMPLYFMGILCKPMSWLLVNSSNIIEKRLEKRLTKAAISPEDIDSAIELTIKDSQFAKQDVDILKSIVRFGNTSATEVMKPRMKVVAIDIDSSYKELVRVFQEEAYSRIPVYKENLDNIKGIIHAKDLLELIGNEETQDWHPMIRKPFFIPKEKKIDDLFSNFQEKRTHMAIVVDEYGGTEGIVTMEDVLEEIVGEIQDEFDGQDEKCFDKVNDYTYDFDGSTPLNEIIKVLDESSDFFDSKREGAETIAGLVLVLVGKIPAVNTTLTFEQYRIIVLATSKRRIEKLRIVLPN